MIHQPTAEELALEKAQAEAQLAAEENNPFDEAPKAPGWQSLIMIAIGFLIIYLAVGKGFEPLLLIPIGFGTVLVNIPGAAMGDAPHGMLHIIYSAGVGNEFFPMLIFMGIGAMTDFGPLIANPKTALLGGAAQFGVFFTLFGVAFMNAFLGTDYTMLQASAISIIGGADGPTSIYVSGKLAPEMMAVIAVAAYSYMALVPMIQPPIMKLLTTKKERLIKMDQLRPVSKTEKVLFPILLLVISILLLPPACPLIGMLAFGNFVKESHAAERLSKTMENELMNIVSILLLPTNILFFLLFYFLLYITFHISCGIKPSCAIYKLIAVIVLDITLYFELHLICIDEIWKSIRDIQNSIFEIIGYLKI